MEEIKKLGFISLKQQLSVCTFKLHDCNDVAGHMMGPHHMMFEVHHGGCNTPSPLRLGLLPFFFYNKIFAKIHKVYQST
jgi:hypothetical protein